MRKKTEVPEVPESKKRFILIIEGAINARSYTDENEEIQTNTSVIVKRLPPGYNEAAKKVFPVQFRNYASNSAGPNPNPALNTGNPNLNMANPNPNPSMANAQNFPIEGHPGSIQAQQNLANYQQQQNNLAQRNNNLAPMDQEFQPQRQNGFYYPEKSTNEDFRTDEDNPIPKYTKEQIETMLTTAKFYIIKSANEENIKLSREHKEWATTRNNEGKLHKAYLSVPNVFLIFSANRSSRYQGFARMDSKVTQEVGQYWRKNENINLGGQFRVEWITYNNIDMGR
jgi:hypothetical protein